MLAPLQPAATCTKLRHELWKGPTWACLPTSALRNPFKCKEPHDPKQAHRKGKAQHGLPCH